MDKELKMFMEHSDKKVEFSPQSSFALFQYLSSSVPHIIRHNNTVHLNIKKYNCQHCFKEFAEKAKSLQHVKIVLYGSGENICDQTHENGSLKRKPIRM